MCTVFSPFFLFLRLIAAKKSNERVDIPRPLFPLKPLSTAVCCWLHCSRYLALFAYFRILLCRQAEGFAGGLGQGVRTGGEKAASEEASARHSVVLSVSVAPLENPAASVSFFGIDRPSAFFIRELYLH